MELLFTRNIEYRFAGGASAQDVIDSLSANITISNYLPQILPTLMPGVRIEGVRLNVENIETGSLKELLTVAIYASHQKDIDTAIPNLLEYATSVHIPDQYRTIVSLSFLMLMLWGAEYVQKFAVGTLDKKSLERQRDALVSMIAQTTGLTENAILRALAERFSNKKTLIQLGKSAVAFFRPSRERKDEPILVDSIHLSSDLVKAIPKHLNTSEMEADPPAQELNGVTIEVRATDDDKDTQGWAGIVRTVSDKRMSMHLYPGIDKSFLRKNKFVTGDIVVNYKESQSGLRAVNFELVRVTGRPGDDEPPPLEKSKRSRIPDNKIRRP